MISKKLNQIAKNKMLKMVEFILCLLAFLGICFKNLQSYSNEKAVDNLPEKQSHFSSEFSYSESKISYYQESNEPTNKFYLAKFVGIPSGTSIFIQRESLL